MQFVVKTVPGSAFISVSKRVTIPEIPEFAGQGVDPLMHKLGSLGLSPSGPIVFFYHMVPESGKAGAPVEMDLEIGVPISNASGNPAPFKFKNTAEFKCLSCVYKGSMKGIGAAWEELAGEVKGRKLQPGAEAREVYHLWKDFDSAENETELQKEIR